MRFAKFAGLTLMLIGAVVACGGSNLPLCAVPVQPAFTLVEPSPGATGVPDNLSDLGFNGSGPANHQVTLAGGTQSMTLTLLPVPQPSGQPLTFDLSASIPMALLASTTYSVTYPITTSGSNCQSENYTVTVGTFTTQ